MAEIESNVMTEAVCRIDNCFAAVMAANVADIFFSLSTVGRPIVRRQEKYRPLALHC